MSILPDTFSAAGSCGTHRSRLGIVVRLGQMVALRRQRRTLAALDPARLADIGLTPEEARAEAARKMWDVPPGWRR